MKAAAILLLLTGCAGHWNGVTPVPRQPIKPPAPPPKPVYDKVPKSQGISPVFNYKLGVLIGTNTWAFPMAIEIAEDEENDWRLAVSVEPGDTFTYQATPERMKRVMFRFKRAD